MISMPYDLTYSYDIIALIMASVLWDGGSWSWVGAPLARSSASSCLTISNELGIGVQLNRDVSDASQIVSRARAGVSVIANCRNL
jgi:hypothetical protein